MSYASGGGARIHDVGPILQCASFMTKGIATWKSLDDFFPTRLDLHDRLERHRELSGV